MRPSDATITLLTALYLPRIGPGTIRKLLGPSTLRVSEPSVEEIESMMSNIVEQVRVAASLEAQQILDVCDAKAIRVLSVFDAEYPTRLLDISDYPPVIFVKGDTTTWNKPCVAVVGTREASQLGLNYARQTAGVLAVEGCCVVSGLALGIDTAAHTGALQAKGSTIAILAHGLDTVSPPSNRKLAEEIVANGGALVSEHAPGVPAFAAEFVRRNRIQSGLSRASIMVESGETGGSIHQARFTTQQRRRLFAVFPSEQLGAQYGFNYGGAKVLESEFGAERIESKEDIQKLAAELRRN